MVRSVTLPSVCVTVYVCVCIVASYITLYCQEAHAHIVSCNCLNQPACNAQQVWSGTVAEMQLHGVGMPIGYLQQHLPAVHLCVAVCACRECMIVAAHLELCAVTI